MNEIRKNLRRTNSICPICGKLHTFVGKENYCEKHYYQLHRYGKILDNSPRSIYDPNEYRIEGDKTFISVYDKRGVKLKEEVIIDTKNIPLILKYKVYIRLSNKGNLWYAYCNIKRNVKVKVHKIILPTNKTVDHINGNTLDNRECNLREASMTIQNLNKITTKGIQKRIYTYKGQYIVKGYAATLGYNKKRYISRYYKTEEEAMYYRYLLLQLLPFKTNYDLSFMNKLSQEQKNIINKDFENRFKNRVLLSACHINLDNHLNKEQYNKLLKVAAENGCQYFTFNVPNSECDDCGFITKHPITECPKCGSKKISYYDRVIG